MPNRPLNTALIGLGMVADTHLHALNELKGDIQLAAVVGRDPDKTRQYAEKAGEILGHEVTAFTDVSALCAQTPLDFAIIATPPNARAPLVQTLAAQGVHILMEKPIERNSNAARAIVDMCNQHHVKLGIVFQHRARPVMADVRDLLARDALGPISLVEVNVPWWRDQSYYDAPGRGSYEQDGGGVLITQAIHTLDLMLSLAGPVTSVQAFAATTALHRMEAEDFVTSGMHFASGAVGALRATTAAFPGGTESITLHGSKGVVEIAANALTIHWRDGQIETRGEASGSGGGADPMAFTHAWHRTLIADFADAIRTDRAPIVTGREALAVHHLIDALIQSARSGKTEEVQA